MYDRIICANVIGEEKIVFVGRESGIIEKYKLVDLQDVPTMVLKGHKSAVTALLLSAAGDVLYSVSSDKTIRFWDISEREKELEKKSRLQKTLQVEAGLRCACLHSNNLYCGGNDGAIYANRETLERWAGHRDVVSCITASLEDFIATGSYDSDVLLWDAKNGVVLCALVGHMSPVKALRFIEGVSGIMSAGLDQTFRLWILPASSELETPGEDEQSNEVAPAASNDETFPEEQEETTSPFPSYVYKPKKKISFSGSIHAPFMPLCFASINPDADETTNTVVGGSEGVIAMIDANKYMRTVSEFLVRNKHEASVEQRRLMTLLRERKTESKKELRAAIRKMKKKYETEQKEELTKKKFEEKTQKLQEREQKRLESRADEEDEEGEEEEPEEVPEEDEEDEEDSVVELSEERAGALKKYEEEEAKKAEKKIAALEEKVKARIKELQPVLSAKYSKMEQCFEQLPFTRMFRNVASGAILSAFIYEKKIISAVEDKVEVLTCVPGVNCI